MEMSDTFPGDVNTYAILYRSLGLRNMPNTLLISQDSLDDEQSNNYVCNKAEYGGYVSNDPPGLKVCGEALPQLVIKKILCYLSDPCDVIHASQTCKQWYSLLSEQDIWHCLYYCQTGTDFSLNAGQTSVYDEVVRLCYDSPKVDILVKDAHADEVLHVSFSNTGKYFCTTSKDCSFKVWLVDNPVIPIVALQMRNQFGWKYTQFSEFSPNDTMLLVSGVNVGQNSNSGHIAVFSVPAFELLSRVPNQPYDVFGCWFSSDTLLSGMLRWGYELNSTSVIYLNHSLQKVESVNQAVRGPLFRFENQNGSSLRMLRVLNFRRPACYDANICMCCSDGHLLPNSDILSCGRYLAFTTGSQTFMPHEIALKRIPEDSHDLPPTGQSGILDSPLSGTDLLIDLRGHLVGLAVDPENSAVFLNVRKWPAGTVVTDPFRPPKPSTELEIRVVDLESGKLLEHPKYRGHKALTGETDCFFIFLDVSTYYVASGAEDWACYLWDRRSTGLLRRIEFANVVNCAAFLRSPFHGLPGNGAVTNSGSENPDPNCGLLVSVSDDRSIKLSFSRRRFKCLPRKLREMTVTELPPDL